MPALEKMKIKIDCEKHEWQYKLSKNDIQVISKKKFRKHFGKAGVYALVQTNSQISPGQKKPSLHGDTQKITVSIPGCIENYADVFVQKNAEQLPPDLAIETEPGKKPPWGPIYPLSLAKLGVLRKYLEESLRKGFIRESKSLAGAPIFFTPNNEITEKNCYPLPLIGEIMDRVNGAKVFSKIDLKEAYHRQNTKRR